MKQNGLHQQVAERKLTMNIDKSTLPRRMSALLIDERGYPVPWFVDWLDGKPEFRAMDPRKLIKAIHEKLCWVCGEKMGVHMVFVAGPMCGINRTTAEPPCHTDCAVWSAINCPFLSNPRMVRREDDLSQEIRESAAGIAIKRNPGVTMLWHTRSYEVWETGNGILITMGEPEEVQWYASGRRATREEVVESIESGIHNLENIAAKEKGATEVLLRQRTRFERYLPA
jgi:hypothetical protein